MISKKSTTASRFMLGCFLLAALLTVSCNNSSEKKGTDADTSAVKPVEQVTTPPAPVDTAKMDTASTRPVKTSD
ncbi:MAG: hypothetical protein HZA79_04835 [Sphingobacteriales bacterium]|nr:hypothetical protein [Sphingobacteriales bacterium]